MLKRCHRWNFWSFIKASPLILFDHSQCFLFLSQGAEFGSLYRALYISISRHTSINPAYDTTNLQNLTYPPRPPQFNGYCAYPPSPTSQGRHYTSDLHIHQWDIQQPALLWSCIPVSTRDSRWSNTGWLHHHSRRSGANDVEAGINSKIHHCAPHHHLKKQI